MGLTRHEALQVLGLEEGATEREIKNRFKQLALKYHPDKNLDNPKAAEEKFQKLSAAYSHLKHEDEEYENQYDAITLAELLIEIFGRKLLIQRRRFYMFEPADACSCLYCGGSTEWREDRRELLEEQKKREYIRDYHEATAKVIGDQLVKRFADKLYNNFNQARAKKDSSTQHVKVSSEEASRNAKQLLEDEEKAKREQEKKREKNKKKKEAKKKRKASVRVEDREESTGEQDDQDEDISEDEIDVSSAFFARASKKQSTSSTPKPHATSKDSSPFSVNGTVSSSSLQSSDSSPPRDQSLLHTVDPEAAENDLAQSRKLASLGNRAAKDGHFGEAVRRYTEAIELYPYDHRYFGNRSYCHDFLQNYTCALDDANRAISLDVSWAKGYYRQGRAYAGLQKLDLAESAYVHALKIDPQYTDAQDELLKIRVEQLLSMGFPPDLCEPAVKEFGSVQSAIDAILAGQVVPPSPVVNGYQEPSPPPQDPPQSKPTRERFTLPPRLQARATQPPQTKTSQPQQPHTVPPRMEKPLASVEKRSLWVGNITSTAITEEMLLDLFRQYGDITSVKLLHPRHCAFINYRNPKSAAQALKELQGYHMGGCYLLIRYPETNHKNPVLKAQPARPHSAKKTGPVNGNECYFWRNTGCTFGSKCRYEHISENKGIDRVKVE